VQDVIEGNPFYRNDPLNKRDYPMPALVDKPVVTDAASDFMVT
jgi:hypothetical protein